MSIRLGTRASPLARWQAEWVAAQLRGRGIAVELVPITTTGDRGRGAIEEIGGQGVFTKEIQLALLEGRIDLAVHSLKDLPTAATPGLWLAAVPERGPPGDALVSAIAASLDALPKGALIGTGSLRRRAQLLHYRRDLQMRDIRGNVDTRLRKLHQRGYDALLLAEAGLRRLGLAHEIAQVVPLEIMLPAVGQGALGLETRAADASARRIVAPLDHPPTHAAVRAERALLAALEGGCLAPVAALAGVDGDRLTLTARVISHDGAQMLEARQDAPPADAEILGRRVGEVLLAQGAGELIGAARAR
jgi:hydroxymethylbilane synthase